LVVTADQPTDSSTPSLIQPARQRPKNPGERERPERLAEERRPVAGFPAQQLQRAISDDGEQAVPVVPHFVQPALALRRLSGGRDESRA
jgi:hypothetical protein